MSGGRRALVASASTIESDPRVLRQAEWLRDAGWMVDTVGRGGTPAEINGRHFRIGRRSVLTRVIAYLLLPNRIKHRILETSTMDQHVYDRPYDLVVVNEIELAPWLVERSGDLLAEGGAAHLDLHEYAPSQRVGLAYRLIFRRYREWMTRAITSPTFSSRSTVGSGIARLYADNFGMPLPAIVRSTPHFVDQAPSPVGPGRIRLVHHGAASLSRGLALLIDALALVDDRFSLEFMLVGSAESVNSLRTHAAALGDRVTFRAPVDVHRVAATLNEYDAELIFFPPITENLRHALPNKFFESVQGRLALIIGPSPEMVELVGQYGNGVVAAGWTARDLADAISGLDNDSVARLKAGSDRAARELSAESEGARFLAALA
ncbi:MAG: hypothetical protein JWP32_2155 [Schumannella sp.]|nr:hypothetical protein [Schumannella sp.]